VKVFAIHDTQGNVHAVVAASPGAPPDAGPGEPGELLSEVELEGYCSEASDEERLEQVAHATRC
jgi:hypothetical protein